MVKHYEDEYEIPDVYEDDFDEMSSDSTEYESDFHTDSRLSAIYFTELIHNLFISV